MVVADHVRVRITGVYNRFEDNDALTCKLGPLEPAYQLFGLSREHRTAYHLYSSGAVGLPCQGFNHTFCKVNKTR